MRVGMCLPRTPHCGHARQTRRVAGGVRVRGEQGGAHQGHECTGAGAADERGSYAPRPHACHSGTALAARAQHPCKLS